MGDVRLCGATLVTCDHTCQADLVLSTKLAAVQGTAAPALAIDLSEHWIFPGLINAHDHLQVNCIPPMPQSAAYPNSYEWARDFQQYRRTPEVVAMLTTELGRRFEHGCLKNLLAGATVVAHHDPIPATVAESSLPVRLLREFGWSHSLGLGDPDLLQAGFSRYGPAVAESFHATPADRPWMIHLAEGTDELAASELPTLASMGCLGGNTILIHGVGLTDEQLELVMRAGACVVWCPSSNLRILGTTLNPRRLFAGQRLLLGTDSRLSGSRDLLDELRVASRHSDLTARELFSLVTQGAAERLRVDDTRPLEDGGPVDLIVLRRSADDPYEQLLSARRADLRMVVRGGQPMIGDVDFSDWFAAAAIDTQVVELDGCRKLLSANLAPAAGLEPGLSLVPSGARS